MRARYAHLLKCFVQICILMLIYTAAFEYLHLHRAELTPEGKHIIAIFERLTPTGETLLFVALFVLMATSADGRGK